MVNIDNCVAYFNYDNKTYRMDLYDFIIFVQENYNFYYILNLKESVNLIKDLLEDGRTFDALKLSSNLYNCNLKEFYYVIDKYRFSVKTFSNIYQFNEIFNINDIINYIKHIEWQEYAEEVEELN